MRIRREYFGFFLVMAMADKSFLHGQITEASIWFNEGILSCSHTHGQRVPVNIITPGTHYLKCSFLKIDLLYVSPCETLILSFLLPLFLLCSFYFVHFVS